MKKASYPQTPLRIWNVIHHHCTRQSRQHDGQAKSAVETVRSFGQVAPCVFGLLERVVTIDRSFEIGQHDIYPAHASYFGSHAPAVDFQHRMRMAGGFNVAKTYQPAGVGLRAHGQTPFHLVVEWGIVEASNRHEHRNGEVLELRIGFHGDHEWLLVLRSAPGLAARVGVVDLRITVQTAQLFLFFNRLYHLALDAPSGLVVDTRCRINSSTAALNESGHQQSRQYRIGLIVIIVVIHGECL